MLGPEILSVLSISWQPYKLAIYWSESRDVEVRSMGTQGLNARLLCGLYSAA